MVVLIVEDDDEIRELLAELLRDEGLDVTTAANGQIALDQMKQEGAPRVVILDLMMPVMDGWELRKRMLADDALAKVPVIITSGAADLAQSSGNLEAKRVFTKPVRFRSLLAEVKAHC